MITEFELWSENQDEWPEDWLDQVVDEMLDRYPGWHDGCTHVTLSDGNLQDLFLEKAIDCLLEEYAPWSDVDLPWPSIQFLEWILTIPEENR